MNKNIYVDDVGDMLYWVCLKKYKFESLGT